MIFIQFIAAFIATAAFSITIEIPKKYIVIAGLVGGTGWVIYLASSYVGISEVVSYFISALIVTIISKILSKVLKAVSTIFLIPGILPIVPGAAMYKMVYAIINNNSRETGYYLLQAILITGGIALAFFIAESIKEIQIIRKDKEKVDENTI